MTPATVEAVIRGLKRAGVSIACYLPDSSFRPLYPALDAAPDIRTIPVTNEGEGAAICGGVFLLGKRAVLVMENLGIRASVEPLTRMGLGAGISVVMLMSLPPSTTAVWRQEVQALALIRVTYAPLPVLDTPERALEGREGGREDDGEAAIRAALAGDLCRCTGCASILRAVRRLAGSPGSPGTGSCRDEAG